MAEDGLQAIVKQIVSTEVDRSLENTNKQVEHVVKALEGMEQRLGYLGDAVTKVDRDLQGVSESAGETSAVVDELTAMTRSTAHNTDNLYERVKSAIAEAQSTGLAESKAVAGMSRDVERVNTTVKALTATGHRFGRALLVVAVALVASVGWLLVKVASMGQ